MEIFSVNKTLDLVCQFVPSGKKSKILKCKDERKTEEFITQQAALRRPAEPQN